MKKILVSLMLLGNLMLNSQNNYIDTFQLKGMVNMPLERINKNLDVLKNADTVIHYGNHKFHVFQNLEGDFIYELNQNNICVSSYICFKTKEITIKIMNFINSQHEQVSPGIWRSKDKSVTVTLILDKNKQLCILYTSNIYPTLKDKSDE